MSQTGGNVTGKTNRLQKPRPRFCTGTRLTGWKELGFHFFSTIALSETEAMPTVPNIVMPFFFLPPQPGRQQAGDVTACHSCGAGKCSSAYQSHMTAPDPPETAEGIQAINTEHTL